MIIDIPGRDLLASQSRCTACELHELCGDRNRTAPQPPAGSQDVESDR